MLLINDTAPFLGQPGDIVTVKPGYARNWLYPNKVAVYAVPNKLEQYAQLVEIGRKRLMNKKQQAALGKGAKEKKQQEEEFNMLRTARTKIAAKILAKRIKMNFSEQTLREVIEGTPVGEAETPAEEVKEAQESLALESKEKLEKLELTFARESSPATGTLFGSVTAEDIVKLVNEKTEEGFLSVSLIDPSLQKQALKSVGLLIAALAYRFSWENTKS
jgi:ribosomal protein L9